MIYAGLLLKKGIRWATVICLVVVLAMFLMSLVQGTTEATLSKLHPALRGLAEEQPSARISVIVQKIGDATAPEEQVAELGGVVTKELGLINAFVAELSGEAIVELAAAEGVRWISLDAPVAASHHRPGHKEGNGNGRPCRRCPANTYQDTLGVRGVWAMGIQGQGVTVAVIDSGIADVPDFTLDPSAPPPRRQSRILARLAFDDSADGNDHSGHGSHIAGIIGGNGHDSRGLYQGIAPMVNFVSLSVSNAEGMAFESDIVEALQWVYENRAFYNIRVVNLSLNSTVEQSYHTSPLNAAAEILWFNGVVVVASAGNKGPGGSYNTANAAPANDPFIITVGATDEHDNASRRDDNMAPFSAHGQTMDLFAKPDIMAPGTNIISVLAPTSRWDDLYPDRAVDGTYFRLSGTSMSAPMVSGAVALLLQDEPHLTPDQVKYRLVHSTTDESGGRPYLDIYAAVTGTTMESANTDIAASQLLWTGDEPILWDNVNWNSVNWNSVNWNSVNWNSVNWNSVNWNSVFWGD